MNAPRRDCIGDYEILEPVGQGSRGRVFKARCTATNNPRVPADTIVALKVLHAPGQDARDAERFRERAAGLCALQHPNIARTLDVFVWRPGEWDEVRCIVTEFLEGETLESRLSRKAGGLDWADLQRFFAQAIAGLAAAAQAGVLHRDLKPSNLFLGADGALRVIDFDVTRKDESGQASTAAWKGSFDYMAPDFVTEPEFRGDERSDIFSLGICFYEALTGKLPFEAMGKGAHVAYLNRWYGTEKPPEISYRSPLFRVLTNARRFVERSVHASRVDRFASFAEMAAEFEKIRLRVIRNDNKDEYELQGVLGRGGFGEVFLARRVRDGMKVAVKHLFAQKQSERFIREARILQRCRHPQICRHIDFFTVKTATEEQYYLVMDFLEGMPGWSLRGRIKKEGALPAEEVVPLFVNYLKALQFLHEGKRPIIHRDLKPTNLYAPARKPEKGCIFDLGVARDVTGTVTYGGIPGTLDYMAPEFARPGSDRGTPQTDLYALGLCFFEALTGTPAFEKLPTNINVAWTEFQTRSEARRAIAFDAPVFKEHPRLAAIVRRATMHDPAERYPSARAMIAELESVFSADADLEATTMATRVTHAPIAALPPAEPSQLPAPPPPAPAEEPTPEPPPTPPRPVASSTRPPPVVEQPEQDEPATMATRMELDGDAGLKWAARQRARRLLLRVAIVVCSAGLALLSYKLVANRSPAPSTGAAEALVEAVKDPQPTAAYVAQVRDCLAKLKAMAAAEPDAASEWQVHIAAVESRARQVPEKFKERFGLASVSRETDEAVRLLGEWQQLKDDLSLLGLDLAAFEERRDYMQRMADRLQFEQIVADLQKRIPARVTDDATLTQAEEAATAYRSLVGKTWEGISADERRKQFEIIGAAVSNLAIAFVAERAAAGDADAYRALPQKSPVLVETARTVYDNGLKRIDGVRRTAEAQQVAKKLQAEVAAAPSVMALSALARQFDDWQRNAAETPAASSAKTLQDAFVARYRDLITAETKPAQADFAAGRLTEGDQHVAAAQALVAQVPERFGRAELNKALLDLAVARQDAEKRVARDVEQKRMMAAEQQRKDAEAQALRKEQERRAAVTGVASNLSTLARGLPTAAPAQWTAVYNALAQTDLQWLREPEVKKAWDAAAAELARTLDAGLLQKEPLADRPLRFATVVHIVATKGAEVVLGGAFAGLQARIEAQRARFILRLTNTTAIALTISSGETLRKTIVPPQQQIDLGLAAPAEPVALPIRVEAGEGWKPRELTIQLAPGGAAEVSLAALEKTEAAPPVPTANPNVAETGILRISVSPRAAKLTLDGQEIQAGDNIVSCDDNHTLRVEAPGYVPFEQSYRVPAGRTKPIDILLEPGRRR